MSDIRTSIIDKLIHLNEEHGDVYILAVDSKVSSGLTPFAEKFPQNFIELGVAEQNAIGVAAGIANEGGKVFVFGISTFLLYRAYEQIRSVVAYNNYSVTIVGMHSGLFYSDQGFTHRQVDDLSTLRGLPNITAYTPHNKESTCRALECAYYSLKPAYIRIEDVLSERYFRSFNEYARMPNKHCSLYGTGGDVLFVSYGLCVSRCIEASELLHESGLKCSVLAVNEINNSLRENYINVLKDFKRIIFVEEHLSHCGVGSIFTQWMAEYKLHNVVLEFIGVSEEYVENMSYEQSLSFYGISIQYIVDKLLTGE
ncbi:transketolase family protein [Vibrio anguillarum]|uniref:transketolase family protein n=1 Tax=Vibrio anguillarum TaxID=55601 RepID=UPI0035945C6B